MSSKIKLEFTGHTKNGQIKIHNKKGFTESVLSVWPEARLKVTVQMWRKNRSSEQNAYLWGVMYPLVMHRLHELGNEGLNVSLVHDYLKGKFLPGIRIMLSGGDIDSDVARNTTTTLTTTEMMDYIAQIQVWAAEVLAIRIPDPNQQAELFK